MFATNVEGRCLSRMGAGVWRCAVLSLSAVLACVSAGRAQTPSPAANGTEKEKGGFTPGWGYGVKFEGSTSGDGTVTDLATGVGYNFSRHFGVDLSVPYYFIGTPSSIKQKNTTAVSGDGVGDVGMDLKWNYAAQLLNYASTIHLGAPTGDQKKGLSVGHATWNFSNHFEHAFDYVTPFVDGGVGNSIADTRFIRRPFMTFGYNAATEAGLETDPGPFSLTASAYDIAPWGNQTVISRVFRCPAGPKCTATGTSTNRRGYTQTSVQKGGASLTRDNGFNAGVEVKPLKYLDLEADYSRSVPLRLNAFSFGISVDLHGLMQAR